MCGRTFSSHVENLAKNKTPFKHRDFINLECLLKMHFRKLEACLCKKSFFNCSNVFKSKGNLCFCKSGIHARKKRFRGLITKKTLLNSSIYEITKFVSRSSLRSLLSCSPQFDNAAILVRNVLRTIRRLWLLEKFFEFDLKEVWLSADKFSKTTKMVSTNRW